MKLMGGLLAPLTRLPVKFLRGGKLADCPASASSSRLRARMVLLEYQVGQLHSTGIGSKCALPVLGHIKAVKGSFRPDVLKSYISHVAGASWVRFDESNIVALDDSNVASMLWSVSFLFGRSQAWKP